MFLLSKHFGKSVRPDPDPTLEIKTDPDPTPQLMYIYCFELLKKTKSIFSMQKKLDRYNFIFSLVPAGSCEWGRIRLQFGSEFKKKFI